MYAKYYSMETGEITPISFFYSDETFEPRILIDTKEGNPEFIKSIEEKISKDK